MKGFTFQRASTGAATAPAEECETDDVTFAECAQRAQASNRPRRALITGATGGIGYELARIMAADGHDLVLVARDPARLIAVAAEIEGAYGVSAYVIARDLAQPAAAAEVHREMRQRALAVDILVNNAGFAAGGRFDEADLANSLQLLQVNVMALTHLTRLFLPDMLQRGWGRLLHVSSIAAFVPGPLTACYNASKAYVLSLSLALSNELRGTGVTSTVLCPGPTRTGFARRARLLGTRAFTGQISEPADVARVGYTAMMNGRTKVIAGLRNKMRMFPVPLVPRSVLAHFSRVYHQV